MEPIFRPKISVVSAAFIQKAIDEAMSILSKVGCFIENPDAYRLLLDHGARPVTDALPNQSIGKLLFPRDLVEKSIQSATKSISLWDIPAEKEISLSGDQVHFDPGSAALFISDPQEQRIRKPVTADLQKYVVLVDKLPHFHLQSTALVSSDVPDDCGDSFRLYLALKLGRKPVVTGIFKKDSFAFMQEMLTLVRGGASQLRKQPLAIFDACPSPPLMWSDLTAHSVIAAAKAGIPSEFVSMPLTGSTSPVTLSGAIVQHCAETLSGVVLAQCAQSGAPVIWGGSPAAMDLRFGTTPMGAIETMMIDLADVAIGKALGLPTHAYMGLSDSKRVDYQAGFESGMGIILAALAGINVVSGPGMMDFESCQSLEKLVLDHEVCGMAYRLLEGVAQRDDLMALTLLQNLPAGGHFLTDPHTLKWFKEELSFPGKAIDRRARGAEAFDQLPTAEQRATLEIEKLLAQGQDRPLGEDIYGELDRMMQVQIEKCS
ncbi:MAG: trimethylamine methyltransferase family protein [bacterium]|nr:trimethylamine methyltransferase family protein [bacterium]